MAEGIRLQLRRETEAEMVANGLTPAGAQFTLRDHARPVSDPEQVGECATCIRQGQQVTRHFVKTYHVQLDAQGCVIVSFGVWEAWQQLADNPFEPANPVPEPPTQGLTLPPATVGITTAFD